MINVSAMVMESNDTTFEISSSSMITVLGEISKILNWPFLMKTDLLYEAVANLSAATVVTWWETNINEPSIV